MRGLLLALVAACAVFAACGDDDSSETVGGAGQAIGDAYTPGPTGQSLDSVTITFETADGEVEMQAEVADSPGERSMGLMFRDALAEDAGMLFVWPEDSNSGFWMENTLVPLTAAFIRADGTIVSFADMEPETTESHKAPEPFRYAIEANQGWFEENGVSLGDTVDLGNLE